MANLTAKQRRFCEEYVIDWNATRAAIDAGYSEKTARSIGQENLTKPDISGYIEEIKQDLQRVAGVSALRNMIELKEIAYSKKTELHTRLKAIDTLNKMLPGAYAPTRTDLTTDGKPLPASPIVFSSPQKDLDLDSDE